ncbi:hypothetical protein GCM10023225_06080 [Kineococcus glutinatus]|uniref:Uncharacterized protein n=1 Tax=Kineococcus glutinatus TaxID=1070872 RepID=A0ABP9HAI9_9ACTN
MPVSAPTAVPPRLPPHAHPGRAGSARSATARRPAVTGRTRPGLVGRPAGRDRPFFRRLAGDGRVDACALESNHDGPPGLPGRPPRRARWGGRGAVGDTAQRSESVQRRGTVVVR